MKAPCSAPAAYLACPDVQSVWLLAVQLHLPFDGGVGGIEFDSDLGVLDDVSDASGVSGMTVPV